MDQSGKISDYLKETGEGCSCVAFIDKLKVMVQDITSKAAFSNQLAYHKSLANETRLIIFKLLELQPLCTCALAEILGMSEGNASHHLKKLEREGLIVGKKTGRFTTYYTIKGLMDLLASKD